MYFHCSGHSTHGLHMFAGGQFEERNLSIGWCRRCSCWCMSSEFCRMTAGSIRVVVVNIQGVLQTEYYSYGDVVGRYQEERRDPGFPLARCTSFLDLSGV